MTEIVKEFDNAQKYIHDVCSNNVGQCARCIVRRICKMWMYSQVWGEAKPAYWKFDNTEVKNG